MFSSSNTGTYALTANTTYRIDCRNNEGATSWKTLTIPVTAAAASCTEVAQTPVTCNQNLTAYGVPSGYTVGNASYTKNSCTNAIIYTGGCSAPVAVAAPSINSFTASPSTVTSGQPTSLSWNITPSGTGTSCRLSETSPNAVTWYDYGRMLLSSNNTGTSNLTANTTYRIDCRNNEGVASSRILSIAVTTPTCGNINGLTNLTTTSWANYTFCSDTATGVYPSSIVRPSTADGTGQYTWTCGTNSCSASISSVAMVSGTSQTASAMNAFESATQSSGPVQGMTSGFSYTFTQDIYRGMQGSEVVALQRALYAEGLFSGEATGNFYDVTREAVMAFQIKYGISPTGYVGSVTREKLNALY